MSLTSDLSYKGYGENSILINWNMEVSPSLVDEIVSFKNQILQEQQKRIQDFIVGYNSLLIIFKEHDLKFSEEVAYLNTLYTKLEVKLKSKYIWEIPVCYDEVFGFDLQQLSKQLDISSEDLIKLHKKPLYTVHFIGFLPGFLYLGGLDKQLHAQRKSTPLLKVPKGAVAIGGEQTGIYPNESAGGWHIIGRTPINFFNVNQDIPCFAKAGDKIQFKEINQDEFTVVERKVAEGSYVLQKTEMHD
ncbi:5-oxoprolinase subunit PxpB [uncultured Tenacibaculum sp.]|uniref:5-oxoprolinase subunit PxpB n=1 Tax=uncultured Tenacibaculum sp. TaxID=174713 RepID=UPI002608730A|nr:5-oxoprolinase subunit PxpB [uncultured Tenacibaculum sp.]